MIPLLLCAVVAASPLDNISVSHRRVTTADGVALALYRYAPKALVEGQRPLLLIPDFGMGRAAYDFEGAGMARWFAQRGRLTYVVELRGQGKAAGVAWSPAEIVAQDLPAIAAALGDTPFDVVAHGWSGALVLAASVKELKGRVGRVISLNTPIEYLVPSRLAETVLQSGGRLAQLGTDAEAARVFELLFGIGARWDPARLTSMREAVFVDLGAKGAAGLVNWMRAGDLRLADGDSLKDRLALYDRPTLQFLALADGWANPELCGMLREVSKAKVEMHTFSRFEPVTEDYSHLSMLLGRGAPKDIFTPALQFLSAELPP